MADIHHAILIAASPEKIYPRVATARGFAEWWAEDVNWICETGDQWNQTHISFKLEARGAQTFLSFAHSGWPSETEYFTSCNTTWGELMFRLKSAAEGKSKGPLFRATELAY